MKRVAVLGASLAGISTARALRAQGYDGELTLVGAEAHRPYDRPPLSKEFLAGEVEPADFTLEMPEEDLQAQWLLGVRATSFDASNGRVQLSDGGLLRADGVVLATGASARQLPGTAGLSGVHLLRTLDDAHALRDDLRLGGELVVIGAGFIGAEVASTARKLGLDVTVVEAAPTPLAAQLGTEMGAAVARLHRDHGTTLLCGTGVRALTGAQRVTGVELADGRVLPADIVVVGVGASPEIGWLDGSGIDVDRGGVRCDSAGATSMPNVVAVGDCSLWFDPAQGRHHRVEHWTAARDRGAVAAATLLGAAPPPERGGRAPYFWSDQYGVRIQFAGHARPDDTVTVEEGSVDGGSFLAVYRRGGEPVAVLGVDQVRLFTRWRRQLAAAPVSG